MDADLGPPIASLALERGTPVYDRTGKRIGVVDGVLGDENVDIFDGVIVEHHALGRPHFAEVDRSPSCASAGSSSRSTARRCTSSGSARRPGTTATARSRSACAGAWERLRGRS